MRNQIISQENYQIEDNDMPKCPIYFEDHSFGGIVSQIENLINYDFGFNIRSTFINGKVYFCANDICKGLALNTKDTSKLTMQAADDVMLYYNSNNADNLRNDNDSLFGYNLYNPINMGVDDTPRMPFGGYQNPVNTDDTTPVPQRGYQNPVNTRVEDVRIPFGSANYNNFENDLYYYLNIEISHPGNKYCKEVKQVVRTLFISEPVLYMLTFRSNKREAVMFKAWLSVEVLPKMRYIGIQRTMNMMNTQAFNVLSENVSRMEKEMKNITEAVNGNIENVDKVYNMMDKMEYDCQANRTVFNQKLDSIGFNTAKIIDNQYYTDQKTQQIAQGLHDIFNR